MLEKNQIFQVIACLNKAREMETQSIHQYMVQKYFLGNVGYSRLSDYLQEIAIDEMRHCKHFGERVDELGGKSLCGMTGEIRQGQSFPEIFVFDSHLEVDTIEAYDKFAKLCSRVGDEATAKLFRETIKDEEIHLKFYRETQENIKNSKELMNLKN